MEVFGKRIENTLEQFPWLVCEIDGKVAGYAYASKHRERAAYQWSADLSIYVDKKYHRNHIATALYTALIELLKSQGYYSAFAGTKTVISQESSVYRHYKGETVCNACGKRHRICGNDSEYQ